MTVRAEHFTESDRDLLLLSGQRLMGWAHDFAFHECDGQTWYRSPDDDPVETAHLLVERIEGAERAACQARRLLSDAMCAAHTRAHTEQP